MAFPQPAIVMLGMTVRIPAGIGFTFVGIASSLVQ
jgi:hypothetical protein